MGMFDNRKGVKPARTDTNHFTTSIGEECIFEGNISTSSSTRIDGTLRGGISGENSIIVGEQGMIAGEVKASEVVVYGKIEGIIESEKLEIKSTGVVTGDIFVDIMVVEAGGIYNGRCTMNERVEKYMADPDVLDSETSSSKANESEVSPIRAKDLRT
jgi:cytoskeletal protein CcmA (bactofilin family)